MKKLRYLSCIVLIALFALSSGMVTATPADAAKELAVGTASVGNTGDETARQRDLSITLKGGFNDVNGLAFTLIYDRNVFEFVGLFKNTLDISDSADYQGAVEDAIFYQANNRATEGRVLVAAAAANFLTTGTADVVPFKARFRVKLGMGSGTYPIGVQQTIIGPETGANAGYAEPTLIPVAVGLDPNDDPSATMTYPVQLTAGAITVTGGYAISGTVTYGTGGTNAAGATVRLFRKVDGQFLLNAETTVGSNGAYTFSSRPAGDYNVVVRATNPGFQSRYETGEFSVAAATTQNIVLAALTPLTGTMQVNGAVFSAVRVEVYDGTTLVGTFPVDASGRFVTSGLDPSKTYTIKAVYGSAQSGELTAVDGVYNWTNLGLGSIEGAISGLADGQQAMVHVMSATAQLERTFMVTGDGGGMAYEVAQLLPAGDYIVSVAGDGIAVTYYDGKTDIDDATSVTVTADTASPNIDFTFATDVEAIEGTVYENDAAVPGVPVFALNQTSFDMLVAYSGADGAFSLQTGAGDYLVFAYKSNGKTFYYETADDSTQIEAEATLVSVAASETKTDINIHLDEATAKIIGQVTLRREGGDPVQGLMVMGRGPKGSAVDVTDAAGNYTLAGLTNNDTYAVTMYPNEPYAPQTKNAAASEAGATLNFWINTGWVISGTVTSDATSNPVAGAWLYLVNSDGLIQGIPIRTGSQGGYSMADIPGGIYTLTLEHPDYKPWSEVVTIQADLTKDVALTQGVSVTGKITETDGVTEIPGVQIIASTLGEGTRIAVSDSNGDYTIEGLTPDRNYFLVVSKTTYVRKVVIVSAPATGTKTGNISLEVLPKLYTFGGEVTSGGSGYSGARVVISSESKQYSKATLTAGDAGAFSFTGVPGSNDYKIVVIPGANKPVFVQTGYTISDDVTDYTAAIPDNTIAGTVTLSDSATGANVQVYLLAASDGKYVTDVPATDNDDGTYSFTFDGVADGSYKIAAFAPGYTFGWFDGTNLDTATAVSQGDSDRDFTLNKQ